MQREDVLRCLIVIYGRIIMPPCEGGYVDHAVGVLDRGLEPVHDRSSSGLQDDLGLELLHDLLLQVCLVGLDGATPGLHILFVAHPDLLRHLTDESEIVTNKH